MMNSVKIKQTCNYCFSREATHVENGTGLPICSDCRSTRSQTLRRNGAGAGIG